jgi:transcriptional regulator with GAF, ATPase, and Fis domain
VHEWSGRSGPFVAVNCAALPKDLAAAELFGHVRGAYSGAHTNRAGIIASADRGTLLLDEIGELPLELQALLLRAVEERTVRPVGGDSERFVDVRFIAATNVALEAWATQGRFRSDLLARLQQVTLRIPALRERKTEILNLAAAFSAQCSRPLELSVSAALYLLGHAWPQNIRELKNVIVRFNALSGSGDCLTSDFLSRNLIPAPARQGLIRPSTEPEPEPEPEEDLEGPERQPIDRVALEQRLRQLGGNVAQLARELRTSRAHIYRLLRRYGIDIGAAR